MRAKPREPQAVIPEFKDIADEAAFWDTHDFSELWDELEPSSVQFERRLSEGLTMRLDAASMSRLRLEARRIGVGPSTLARIWIIERLRDAAQIASSRSSSG